MADTNTIPAATLCEITEWTDRRHRQLAEEGHFPPPVKGHYQLVPVLRGILAYLRAQMEKQGESLKEEQHKLTKVRREKVEIERDQLGKKLVDKVRLIADLASAHQLMKQAIQYNIEQVLAPNIHGKTQQEVMDVCRRCVDVIYEDFTKALTQCQLTETPETPTSES